MASSWGRFASLPEALSVNLLSSASPSISTSYGYDWQQKRRLSSSKGKATLMEHCPCWKRLVSGKDLRLRPELSDDTLKLIDAGDRGLNGFTVNRMRQQRRID